MSDHVTLGRYKIIEELGRGGSGIVYRAIDTNENRTVALKIMHPRLINEPEFIERFRQEAELSATLKNKHLVPTYDHGEIDGRLYISMELMDGGSLKTRISQNGPYSPQDAIEVIHQICIGLNEIHALDIIHRDLKPGNILFDKDDNVKISDLGFAKILDAATSLSKTGEVIGTPSYMSPEIWRSGKITAKADIYSLACIIVEMLTANVLFDGESTPEIMLQHYQPAKLPYDLPTNWRTSLIKALAIEPNQRHETVMELYEELKKASSSSYQDEPKTGWEARPVIGSEPPTPLPSRPLFGHETPAPAGFTAPQASPKPTSAPSEQTPSASTQPAQEQAKAPIPPKTTSASSTSNTQIPIFRPIERPSQRTSLTPGKQASSSQPVSSAVPIFQPARSGNTPKPAVPPPLPAQFVAKPAIEHSPPPKSSPLKKQSDALPTPPKPDEAKLAQQKHKKKPSRRELRMQERAAIKQSFKPLFPDNATGESGSHTNLGDDELKTSKVSSHRRILVSTTQAKQSKKKTNLILGIFAGILFIGVLILGSWLWIDHSNNIYRENQTKTAYIRTATYNSQKTSTAQFALTATSEHKQTATASYKQTATAEYKQTATVQSIRQIPNRFAMQSDITRETITSYKFKNEFLQTFYPANSNNYYDFSLTVSIHNPESLYEGETWHHIIGFRNTGSNDQYRFYFYPRSGNWKLDNYLGSVDNVVNVKAGNSSSISSEAGKNNRIQLIAKGNNGYVFINNIYVTMLDLSARDNKGKIWIATEYDNSNRDGFETEYSGIALYSPN